MAQNQDAHAHTPTPTPSRPTQPAVAVSVPGKGSYQTGGWVAQDAPTSIEVLPVNGRYPEQMPQLPPKMIERAAGKAPVTNRWWSMIYLPPGGAQLQDKDGKVLAKEADFSQPITAQPLYYIPRRDGMAFSLPSALAVLTGSEGELGIVNETLSASYVIPTQAVALTGLNQVILSSTAVPNRRTLGPDWTEKGRRFTTCAVSDFSDWWVQTTFATDNGHHMITSIGTGSPMWHARFSAGDTGEVSVNTLDVTAAIHDETLIVEAQYLVPAVAGSIAGYEGGASPVDGRVTLIYAFFGEPGSTWRRQPASSDPTTTVFTNVFEGAAPGRETHVAAAVLPDKEAATIAAFRRCSMSPVVGSTVTPTLDRSQGTVTVDVRVDAPVLTGISRTSGYDPGTILSLSPHHYLTGLRDGYEFQITDGAFLASSLSPSETATLPSLLGPQKLMVGSAFQQKLAVPAVLFALAPSAAGNWFDEKNPDRVTLHRYLDPAEVIKNDLHGVQHLAVYDAGKRMAKYVNAASIAEVARMPDRRAALLGHANMLLTGTGQTTPGQQDWNTWFCARNADGSMKNIQQPVLWYSQDWKSMCAYPESYGCNLQLNDHHFIYGYFIRTAAEIARNDPAWRADWGAMVDILVRDILTTRRDVGEPDSDGLQFPFLRTFDPWAGHSWATGADNTPNEGPNQESTSEAIDAWESVVLWARTSQNAELETWASYLLASEVRAARCYWFDVTAKVWRPRLPSFEHIPSWGMAWGTKLTNVNFFNFNWATRPGIQILPINASSIYHGVYPDAVARTIKSWLERQPIADYSDITQWQKSDDRLFYPFWCDTWWSYFAMSSDPGHVAFADKVVTPSAPGSSDGILDTWPLTQDLPPKTFHQFDEGNSKANVFWFIKNAKANLTGDVVKPLLR